MKQFKFSIIWKLAEVPGDSDNGNNPLRKPSVAVKEKILVADKIAFEFGGGKPLHEFEEIAELLSEHFRNGASRLIKKHFEFTGQNTESKTRDAQNDLPTFEEIMKVPVIPGLEPRSGNAARPPDREHPKNGAPQPQAQSLANGKQSP